MRRVEKVWGYEEIPIATDLYTLKFLHISPRRRCSLHLHFKKDECFLVYAGIPVIEINGDVKLYHPGDTVRVPPETLHRFGNHGDTGECVLIEVSTKDDDLDVRRLEQSGPIPEA